MTIVMAVAALFGLAVLRRRGVFARNAFEPPKRDVESLDGVMWLGVALLVYLAWVLGQPVGAALVGEDSAGAPVRANAIVSACTYACGVVALGVLWTGIGARLRKGGFRFGWSDLARGAGALLIAYPTIWLVSQGALFLAEWIASMRGGAPPDTVGHMTLEMLASAPRDVWWWLVVGSVVIGAPVVEEVVWRGGVQSALRRLPRVGGWGSILITASVFTAMHADIADLHALPTIFTLAVAMGVLFERTGRLGAAICMHAGFNALNIAIAVAQAGAAGSSP